MQEYSKNTKPKKKEDHFQKELDYFLSKPEYNLRSHNEKVGETVY